MKTKSASQFCKTVSLRSPNDLVLIGARQVIEMGVGQGGDSNADGCSCG